ncbi:GspE/PulE family protein [Variovorax sp. YR752]|uniref:GspE/PulE family protein n=1 Tax=Variovorax sp. YR752 TaxID=1884383 RepID=UPI003137F1A9
MNDGTAIAAPHGDAARHVQDMLTRLGQRFAAASPMPLDGQDAPPPVREAAMKRWLSEGSGLTLADLTHWTPEQADVELVPFSAGQQRLCVVLRDGTALRHVVLADPFDAGTRMWLESRIRAAGHPPTVWYVASVNDVAAFYARLERETRALDGAARAEVDGEAPADAAADVLQLSLAGISADESPVVRFVNGTLYDALKAQASDIHLECAARGLAVKYRLDGVLQAVARPEGREFADRVVSRIKVLADLDISERRVPQDGRLKLSYGGRAIDVRVSIMPNLYGEDAVLRILDRYQLSAEETLSIEHLGFDAANARFIRRLGAMPYGLLLVTGPTGSGKTTTLYAVLSEVNTGQDKIITIEDPVEYQLPDVLQIPVNEAKGLTFARGLRSILRHDPDKIMVGEMRDAETAQIAIQAALTGHQVFATVHANNVFDVIGRLSTMGVDPYNLVSALNGVVAQRLVRIVCPHCSVSEQPAAERLEASALPEAAQGWNFKRGIGCAHCRGTGYKGRRAIAQTLAMDIGLRSLITERASPALLRDAARERGLRTLREAALELVAAGQTTLEEANRVTAVEE